jgi:hypothetical protein
MPILIEHGANQHKKEASIRAANSFSYAADTAAATVKILK